MTQTTKIAIYNKAGATFGPYHWKHVVEWSEFDLLDDYTCLRADGESVPVSKLVSTVGVPPTISTHAIFLTPTSQGQSGSPEAMRKLKVLSFPSINGGISEELGTHLVKRLLMSDEALNAEDPAFEASGLKAFATTLSEAPEQAITPSIEKPSTPTPAMKEDPQKPEGEATTPAATNLNTEDGEASENQSNTAADPKINPFAEGDEVSKDDPTINPFVEADEVSRNDPTINPFAEGDEVSQDDADDDDFTPIRKTGSNKVIFLIIALLVIGGAGAAVFIQQQKNEASPTPAATATEKSSDSVETDMTTGDTPKRASEIVDKIVEETTKEIEDQLAPGVKNAVQKAVDDTVDDEVLSATKEAKGKFDSAISDATATKEASQLENSANTLSEKSNIVSKTSTATNDADSARDNSEPDTADADATAKESEDKAKSDAQSTEETSTPTAATPAETIDSSEADSVEANVTSSENTTDDSDESTKDVVEEIEKSTETFISEPEITPQDATDNNKPEVIAEDTTDNNEIATTVVKPEAVTRTPISS